LDVIFRDERLARGLHLALQRRIKLWIEAVFARSLAIAAGSDDGVQMLVGGFGARDQRRDLLLLNDLPVDEILDVRMIGIDNHHFRRAAGRAARLDGARSTIADAQK